MLKSRTITLTLMVLLSAGVHAHNTGTHFVNSSGDPWQSSAGGCWTNDFHAGESLDSCGGTMAKPAPEDGSAPTQVAIAEPAEPEINLTTKAFLQTLTLDGAALFGTGSDRISRVGRASIRELVEELRTYQSVASIVVKGHTDSQGPRAANQKLSERRAEAVKQRLIQEGVNPTIIQTLGFGETDPISDNATSTGRRQNRRVELDITATP